MSRAVQGLSGIILVGILIQSYLLVVMLIPLYLSPAGDFVAVSRQWHLNSGYVLGVPILLLMIVSLATRLGWREVGGAALLGALFVGQVMLGRVQIDTSYVSALYAMNGLAMVGLATAIDRSQGTQDDDPDWPVVSQEQYGPPTDRETIRAEPTCATELETDQRSSY